MRRKLLIIFIAMLVIAGLHAHYGVTDGVPTSISTDGGRDSIVSSSAVEKLRR